MAANVTTGEDDTETTVAVRVKSSLVQRMDAVIEGLREDQPHIRWDRSKVLRAALYKFVRELEG